MNRSNLYEVIDDVAFRTVKLLPEMQAQTDSWRAYSCFLRGYQANLEFMCSGDASRRDEAMSLYLEAVQSDPEYDLAQYNLGTLLYDKYLEEANASAIAHFNHAIRATSDVRVRARALSGISIAYAQNVHRYGLGVEPWALRAKTASVEALELDGTLEEAQFASAWAHQVVGETDLALNGYRTVLELAGDTPGERQIRSFAANNRAWLLMQRGYLNTAFVLLFGSKHQFSWQ